jgi:hypothetical protein
MRDNISCEEVFEADPQARAEFDVVCDEWQNEAIEAQDADEEWVKSVWGCSVLFEKSEWERQSS